MATGEKDTFDALCTNDLVALAGGDDAGDEEDDAESAEEE